MKTKIILIVVSLLVLGVGGTYYWHEFNSFEAKHESVTIELGTEISANPSDYIEAREAILSATEIDKSSVDIHTANTYMLYASWRNKTVEIDVIVKDTVSPTIILKELEKDSVLVNTELTAMDFIESIEDQAGIKSIKFETNQVELTEVDSLDTVFKFDTAGIQNVKVYAEDMSGNITETSFSLKVIEDYLAHAEGFSDIKTVQGITPDWLSGITMSEKIVDITADDSGVDINTPGNYTLNYYIYGDDNETVVTKGVSVKVIEDYLAHVDGITDIKTEQGITPDWLSGITKNDKIIEIVADAAKVDINTPGKYTLSYYINGDDNETVVTKMVTVTVEKPKPTTAVAKKDGVSKASKTTNDKASTTKTDTKNDKDAQARAVAKEIVASIPSGTDLERITAASEAVQRYTYDAEYMMTGENYNLPYGVFIAGEYSCAGTSRALGMLLEIMGYQWEHINPNQYTHQWVTVKNMDGKVGWADGQVGLAGYGEYPFEGAKYIYQPYEGSDWEPVSFVGE
ncbi:hypothetical protein [Amphibacillus indicireducens]|uniref:DUF5011 domain-containing protein n=1 Tax=Amphibacillus indicireducens TaxID=1076330 RepID=A0ABP7VUS7_9BACI